MQPWSRPFKASEMACFDYSESFINSYNVYRNKSDEVAKSKEILDIHLPSILRKILDRSKAHRHLSILSVGSGDGEIDSHIIEIVLEGLQGHENAKIFNRALEPNPYYVNQCKEKLKKEASTAANGDQITYEVLQKAWQNYILGRSMRLEQKDTTRFDLVHFVHCMFYAAGNDLEGTLLHCFENELKNNGQIVCISSEFIKRNIMPKLWPDGKYYEESLPEQIVKIADKRGWKVDVHKHEYTIDVTEVFDDNSKEGNVLLDFLTQTKDFCKTQKDKVEECLQVMRDLSTFKDGKYLIDKFDDVLFIYL